MNIFLVTSCIKTLIGKIDHEERYVQTLKTFDSVREKAKDSIIIFCDSSIGGLEEDKKQTIRSKVDHFLDYSINPVAQELNQKGLKSAGETYLLKSSIVYARNIYNLNRPGRMFKLGGRCELLENFSLNDYENVGENFVFKKRLDSWMPESDQKVFNSTHILETRLYSWSFSLINEYLSVLDNNMQLIGRGLDTEHAHFLNIPKDRLIEVEKLNVGCFVAAGAYYIED